MGENLLAAFDGSASAADALKFAARLAKNFQSTLHVLTVVRPLECAVTVEMEATLEQARRHGEQLLQQARTMLAGEPFEMHFHLALGQPAEQIVRFVDTNHVDHIIVGHRGHSVFERWLIGSVARQVITHANCTITVVRRKG